MTNRVKKWAVAFGAFAAIGATALVEEWLPSGDLVTGKPKVEAPAPKPKAAPKPSVYADRNYDEARAYRVEAATREALLHSLNERLENEMLDEYYPGWRD